MKHIKMLGVLAAVVAALLIAASSASATTATSPAGTTYTSTLKAESGTTTISGSFVTVECGKSTTEGKVESHGAAITLEGKFSITLSSCNYPVTVVASGSFSIHGFSVSQVTVSGLRLSIHTSVGNCEFTFNNTTIGNITNGTPAKLNIGGAKIPRTGGSAGFLCGSTGTWTGTYTYTTPGTLLID